MSDIEYRLFDFSDVFQFQRGERLIKVNQMDGDIPYISSTKENNGVDNYINPPEYMTRHINKMTLSNSGSVGILFYHEYEFVASDHATVIWLKDESVTLNKEIALFLKPVIESMSYKYNFGREISNARIEREKVLLPVDENDNPNWAYMVEYISNASQVIRFNSIKSANSEYPTLNREDWKNIALINIFDMYAGRYYPQENLNQGDTPLVSASSKDNGILVYTDLDPVFEGNCITIGKVDMSVFYQEIPFCATSDVTVLVPKYGFNKYIALFIITVMKQEAYKWSYGRQIRLNDSQRLSCELPVKKVAPDVYEFITNSRGEPVEYLPDWEFMENYIRSMEYGDKI